MGTRENLKRRALFLRSRCKSVLRLLVLPLVVFLTACFAFSAPVHAAQTVPYKINFQGRLTNISGTVLTGSYDMQFKLYTALTGGTLVWSETRTTANANAVTVTNGLFNVLIGEGTAVPGSSATLQAGITANTTLYMEVMVGAETLTPRSQFGSSAYSINSDMVDGIDGASLAQLGTTNAFTAAQSVTVASANAFQAKNGSTNLFNVDTTNSIITVGVSDTTGAALVLDVKSDSGDPVGGGATPGAMYYNSNLGKFRCYQVSAWVDCITAPGGATLQTAYDSSGTPATITTSSAGKTLLFKAGSGFDTAALFDIQNAAGTSMFMVDSTTNNRVYIGDNTADATGTVLVLDTKNNATNPTGVDGAMYYNSVEKSFRCYKNGLWGDCSFASLRSEWVLQEEWRNANATMGSLNTMGDNNWTSASIGTGGTITRVNVGTDASNRDRWGVMQMNSPATVNTGTNFRLEQTGMAGVPTNMTIEFDFAPVNAAAANALQQVARIGLHDSTTTAAPTDGIYFQYNATTAAANWFRCTRNASAETCTDTGVARTLTANVYQRFKIQTNSTGTSVEFFINEASVGSNTTNLPAATAAYGPTITVYTIDATVRQWKTDYYQIKRSLTTLR